MGFFDRRRKGPPLSDLPLEHRRLLYLVGAALVVNHFDIGIASLALPQIQASLNVPEERLGLFVGIARLGVLAAFALGILADVIGRRTVLIFTVVGITICTLLTAVAQGEVQFLVLQFLVRAFAYAEEALCFVLIVEVMAADRRGWAVGRLAALGALGTGLSAVLFGHVGSMPHGWRDLYLIGGIGFALLIFARRTLKETARFEAHRAERLEQAPTLALKLEPLRGIWRDNPRRFLAVMLLTLPWAIGMSAAQTLFSKHMQSVHELSPRTVGGLYALAGIAAIFGNIIAGRIADRVGRRRLLMVSIPGAVLLYAVLYLSDSANIAIAAWMAGLFFMFATEMTLAMYASELFPTAYRATATSARVVMLVVGGFLGLAMESLLYSFLGSHALSIAALLCLVPVSLLFLFLLPETARREVDVIDQAAVVVAAP